MIFTIHMAVFESFGEVQSAWELLGRWAVPVFFIASAYFLFSANNGSVEYANIKKYIYRIGMLYLFWFIFNLPNFICVRFLKRPPHTMYDFLMIAKNSVLSSTFTGSWYLLSSIFCAWLLFVLKKKRIRSRSASLRSFFRSFVSLLRCIKEFSLIRSDIFSLSGSFP